VARQFAAARADCPESGGLLTRLASSLHSRYSSDPIGIALGRAIRSVACGRSDVSTKQPLGEPVAQAILINGIEQEGPIRAAA
jgi:hypothetical protein